MSWLGFVLEAGKGADEVVDSYEDDIFASEAVTLVIDVMENNKNDEDVLVSALKFLGSMATSGKYLIDEN